MDSGTKRLIELHIEESRLSALRIFAHSSTIVAKSWEKQVGEEVTRELYRFALNARRINDLCELRMQFDCSAMRFSYHGGLPQPVEANFAHALNRLAHAKEYSISWTVYNFPDKVFENDINQVPTHVLIKTDKKDSKLISLFGLSQCFLGSVISKLKDKYPLLQF